MMVGLAAGAGTVARLVAHGAGRAAPCRVATVELHPEHLGKPLANVMLRVDVDLVKDPGLLAGTGDVERQRVTVNEDQVLVRNPGAAEQHRNHGDVLHLGSAVNNRVATLNTSFRTRAGAPAESAGMCASCGWKTTKCPGRRSSTAGATAGGS